MGGLGIGGGRCQTKKQLNMINTFQCDHPLDDTSANTAAGTLDAGELVPNGLGAVKGFDFCPTDQLGLEARPSVQVYGGKY